MNNVQALYDFWASFGLPAYEQNSVPDNASMPYITYEIRTADFDAPVQLTADIWYRSTSWAAATQKANEISDAIGTGCYCNYDDGCIFITKSLPFAQYMGDDADSVKRIYIMCSGEYI